MFKLYEIEVGLSHAVQVWYIESSFRSVHGGFFNSIMFVNIPTSFLTDKNSADACSLETIVSNP